MKKKKVLAFLLLVLIAATSFYGCYPVNYASNFERTVPEEDLEQTNKRPVALSQPADLGSPFCIQATPNAETYGYGEEIEITVKFKFNMLSLGMNDFMSVSKNSVDCSLILEESPSFEIVGENTVTFENVDRYYYECSDANRHSFENPLVATFKIRIYEGEYDIYDMCFSVLAINNSFDEEKWKDYPIQDDIDADREFRYTTPMLIYYITDSQGIIMSSSPVYNHSYSFGNPKIELIEKSFEREQLNGIDDEILINRYLDMLFDDSDVFYCLHTVSKKIPWYLRERFTEREETCYYFSYISKDVRFRVYIPFTDTEEFYETLKSLTETDSKASLYEKDCQRLRSLLDYALENGVISEDEYNTEINRLETEEIFCRHVMYIDKVETIPSPDDDSYYNHVLDPRVDWDKAYPTFWEWLVQSIKEMFEDIF